MTETEKQTPSILAEQTLVERKGENRLDRQVHQVIHHAPAAADDTVELEAEQQEVEDAVEEALAAAADPEEPSAD